MNALEKIKKQIKGQIVEKQEQLRRLEDALAALEAKQVPEMPAFGPINLKAIRVPDRTSRKTLIENVTEIIGRFGDQEFTVNHVAAILGDQGNLPKAKAPKARVAVVLKMLADERVIVRTFKGGGNVPNRFRVRSQGKREQSTLLGHGARAIEEEL